jgi:hypothetical protein
MPIQIDDMQTQVDVQTSDTPAEPQRQHAPAEALPRWQQLASRHQELDARLSAWNFDD